MSEIQSVTLALATGCMLGTLFYAALWWTVVKGMASAHSALWFFASFWLRLGMVLTGFYEVANGDWKRMLACLAGFIIARFAGARLMRERAYAH